jgi:hypothetical protein
MCIGWWRRKNGRTLSLEKVSPRGSWELEIEKERGLKPNIPSFMELTIRGFVKTLSLCILIVRA